MAIKFRPGDGAPEGRMNSSLARFQGPEADTTKFERHAKALFKVGGALLLKHQMDELTPAARAEVERLMERAYGKRPRT